MDVVHRPKFSLVEAELIAQKVYGILASAKPLPSERDQNFKLNTVSGEEFVLKIAHPEERKERLEFENFVIEHLNRAMKGKMFPRLMPTLENENITQVIGEQGTAHFVRLVSFLPGVLLANIPQPSKKLLQNIGQVLAAMDHALTDIRHPAMLRFFQWDVAHAPIVIQHCTEHLATPDQRVVIKNFLSRFERQVAPLLLHLRRSVIHNDLNDCNILVEDDIVSGIVDFGDMLYSYTVNDLAVACAYIMLGKNQPLEAVIEVIRSYHVTYPLTTIELEVLMDFIMLRLCLSVCISAKQQKQEPDNPYLSISEPPAWRLLERISCEDIGQATEYIRTELKLDHAKSDSYFFPLFNRNKDELLSMRYSLLGRNLSLAYHEPLKIVRGFAQYLYDEDGKQYLDCVNNVCHVGHCHPRVVAAGQQQMALLNTNTRYLHDNIIEYARRLTEILPEPLQVCFFVNSGSEANELALRLARTYTGYKDVIVLDHAYHGHTQALIEVSPYKFNHKGGKGKPEYTHVVPIPDTYRGIYKASDPKAGKKYAQEVELTLQKLKEQGRGIAAFLFESLPGCAGQILLAEGYLAEAFRLVRAAGGVCIADEVQVGFGRVGSHIWGFEVQHVVPDIVTLGKPAGNGHPLAAVVTTRTIADSFDNGMEYFNTFGGNPVSCAIGLAVLNVIQEEQSQRHALEVGDYFMDQLRLLQSQHQLIGDVRGLGLFIGTELVRDRTTLEPATMEAKEIINRMRDRCILLSTDGPFENVIKIKPPMVFSRKNIDQVIYNLNEVLEQMSW